jgi:ubiquilin
MSNPAIMDQIINSNPQLQAMGPQVRQMFNSPMFREMLSNPDSLRSMMQMANTMRGSGSSPFGPGLGPNPGAPNAFGSLFNPPATTPNTSATPTSPSATGTNPTSPGATGGFPPFNPFAFDPALMQQMMAGWGGPGGAAGTSAAPTQPPEERFATQLEVCKS